MCRERTKVRHMLVKRTGNCAKPCFRTPSNYHKGTIGSGNNGLAQKIEIFSDLSGYPRKGLICVLARSPIDTIIHKIYNNTYIIPPLHGNRILNLFPNCFGTLPGESKAIWRSPLKQLLPDQIGPEVFRLRVPPVALQGCPGIAH